MTPADFIQLMLIPAQQVQAQSDIPASFTIAQGALESAWFESQLAQQAFNLFGIKASSAWTGDTITMPTHEVEDGVIVEVDAAFRKYPDLASGLADHALFLTENPRYAPAFGTTDSIAFAQAVAAAGYATDPEYATKITEVIRTHNLQQYDTPQV